MFIEMENMPGTSMNDPAPDCGNDADWIEEYDEHYCWNFEDYFEDME